jgi:hypothetical protein
MEETIYQNTIADVWREDARWRFEVVRHGAGQETAGWRGERARRVFNVGGPWVEKYSRSVAAFRVDPNRN